MYKYKYKYKQKNNYKELYKELCVGCGHRTSMFLLDEIISQYNIQQQTIFVFDVACCSLLIDNVNYDAIMSPHGRCIPVSIGIKSVQNDKIVINYMGDSAAYSIGLNELMHSAIRNNHLLNIIINNQVCAMTGGQLSPTSLIGQKTSSSINGKSKEKYGEPFKIENLLENFNIGFLARVAVNSTENIAFAKETLKKAFEHYMNYNDFSLVEIISPCPTNFHLKTKDCYEYITETVLKEFKIGIYKGN